MKGTRTIHSIALIAAVLASAGAARAQQKAEPPVSGTPGRVTKFTSATTVGDSVITENKFGQLGVGTAAPTSRLTVVGVVESVAGGTLGGGFKFPDGSVQKSAGLTAAQIVGSGDIVVTPSGNTVVISAAPAAAAFPLVLTGEAPGQSALVVKNNGGELAAGADISASITASGEGGIGVVATGGRSDDGSGGDGLSATGGDGAGDGRTGGIGIVAVGGSGLHGASVGRAALLVGDVTVIGVVERTGAESRKIDYPFDPENKYLVHAAVESSELLNVYSGNVTTDGRGVAVVELPDWFEAVNTDLRYQLTVLGTTFARALVAEKVADNRFTIKTDEPNVEVSWQVTGVRADAAARKRAFTPVEEKPENERGLIETRREEAIKRASTRGN